MDEVGCFRFWVAVLLAVYSSTAVRKSIQNSPYVYRRVPPGAISSSNCRWACWSLIVGGTRKTPNHSSRWIDRPLSLRASIATSTCLGFFNFGGFLSLKVFPHRRPLLCCLTDSADWNQSLLPPFQRQRKQATSRRTIDCRIMKLSLPATILGAAATLSVLTSVNGFTQPTAILRRTTMNAALSMSTMAESGVPPTTSDASDTEDVEIPTNLPSDCGMDYIPLATMLATGQLAEADQVCIFFFWHVWIYNSMDAYIYIHIGFHAPVTAKTALVLTHYALS